MDETEATLATLIRFKMANLITTLDIVCTPNENNQRILSSSESKALRKLKTDIKNGMALIDGLSESKITALTLNIERLMSQEQI